MEDETKKISGQSHIENEREKENKMMQISDFCLLVSCIDLVLE